MSEDCHDSHNKPCEYCGEMDHAIADCPDLADWRERESFQDMAAEAAYYQVPDWEERLGK